MSFADYIDRYRAFDFAGFLKSVDERNVEAILARDRLDEWDFLALLSTTAGKYLEPLARKAHDLTKRHFGNVVFLFTPMYIANYCDNKCRYCSFSRDKSIRRRQLSLDEIHAEARRIAQTGMRHILVLTGESRGRTPVSYLKQSIEVVREHFSSVGIEVYPLTENEYEEMIESGVDSLTIYQEVYDPETYHRLHRGGPKDNYRFRLDAPERACRSDMHAVSIGALLGLADYRTEAFFTALHLKYLQRHYPATEISVSLPRIRPLVGDFPIEHPVDDRRFVQLLLALRLFRPTVGITVSTRESPAFRDAIVPLGVTRMSAGVSTAVGGHSGVDSTTQFEIADTRSVDEVRERLTAMGYQPVMHDWNHRLLTA